MNMAEKPRLFVSFSSHDLKVVREIMAALKGQGLDFWDYSDLIQSIEIGETINTRLFSEIDSCTHMVVIISKNSMDYDIGHYCRLEMHHAAERSRVSGKPTLIPVLLGSLMQLQLDPPYDVFKNVFCQEMDNTLESIVKLTIKVCNVVGKIYVPPIEAHPFLPFWKLFREEVETMAHSNKEHTDIMMILGEFNEHYRKAGTLAQPEKEMKDALDLINFFILACKCKKLAYTDSKGNKCYYQPFYPWIVKAVCESELGMFDAALESYERAKLINPDDQDVIGGMGTVYFKTNQYGKAVECFERIIRRELPEDTYNARINLITTKQAMGTPLSNEEERFLFGANLSRYPDDLKNAIVNAQGIQYKIKRDYVALEKHCRSVIAKNLHDTITIRLLQIAFLNRGMTASARQVIDQAVKDAERNPRLKKDIILSFY